MWIQTPLLRSKLFTNEKRAILVVIALAVIVRAIPELVAYPHPIGYDVVNYYLPVVANFDSYWNVVSGQFPVYVILLHAINSVGPSPYWTVIIGAVGTFGFFSAAIFSASRSLMKLNIGWSIFVAIFVMFQLTVLRASWDEHRDVFALSTAILVFVLIGKRRDNLRWETIALAVALSGITAASDRQVGALFCATILIYSVIVRSRPAIICTIAASAVFIMLFLFSGHNGWILQRVEDHLAPIGTNDNLLPQTIKSYGSTNLLIYFLVMDSVLVPAAIHGFTKTHIILKIALVITIIASFSWIILPNAESLVANRWITLAGIFLAIFSARGIARLLQKVKMTYSAGLAAAVLSYFIVAGLEFALLPYDAPYFLFATTRDNIQEFSPVTMQFNSLQLDDNDKITSAIAWINANTEHDAAIVGQKYLLGFMRLYLEDQRSYYASDTPQTLAETLEGRGLHVYLFKLDGSKPDKFVVTDYSTVK